MIIQLHFFASTRYESQLELGSGVVNQETGDRNKTLLPGKVTKQSVISGGNRGQREFGDKEQVYQFTDNFLENVYFMPKMAQLRSSNKKFSALNFGMNK